jgi:hypothetical protein
MRSDRTENQASFQGLIQGIPQHFHTGLVPATRQKRFFQAKTAGKMAVE